jgi:hypothetical protein
MPTPGERHAAGRLRRLLSRLDQNGPWLGGVFQGYGPRWGPGFSRLAGQEMADLLQKPVGSDASARAFTGWISWLRGIAARTGDRVGVKLRSKPLGESLLQCLVLTPPIMEMPGHFDCSED